VIADGTYFSLLSTLNLSTYYSKGVGQCLYENCELVLQVLSHFYYFIIILKSPPRLSEAKNLAVQLFIDCGCCLFEFCRETSPFSLVCGVMLLPHFSQSVTKPGHP
jgi:hypothetical protein